MFVLKGGQNIILVRAGLTGEGAFAQEREVGCEGTYSKSLLSCEAPAQGRTYHVVNCMVKHLRTHKHTDISVTPAADMTGALSPVTEWCFRSEVLVFWGR